MHACDPQTSRTHFVKPFPSTLMTMKHPGRSVSSSSNVLTYSYFELAMRRGGEALQGGAGRPAGLLKQGCNLDDIISLQNAAGWPAAVLAKGRRRRHSSTLSVTFDIHTVEFPNNYGASRSIYESKGYSRDRNILHSSSRASLCITGALKYGMVKYG